MKGLITIIFLVPLLLFAKSDTTFNSNNQITNINQEGIDNLVSKYKLILKNKKGIEGWRLQIKFTSKREDILRHQSLSMLHFSKPLASQMLGLKVHSFLGQRQVHPLLQIPN